MTSLAGNEQVSDSDTSGLNEHLLQASMDISSSEVEESEPEQKDTTPAEELEA